MSFVDDIFIKKPGGQTPKPYCSEKRIDGRWVKMGEFSDIDDDMVQNHATALGGHVRLMKRDETDPMRQWKDGRRIEAA